MHDSNVHVIFFTYYSICEHDGELPCRGCDCSVGWEKQTRFKYRPSLEGSEADRMHLKHLNI